MPPCDKNIWNWHVVSIIFDTEENFAHWVNFKILFLFHIPTNFSQSSGYSKFSETVLNFGLIFLQIFTKNLSEVLLKFLILIFFWKTFVKITFSSTWKLWPPPQNDKFYIFVFPNNLTYSRRNFRFPVKKIKKKKSDSLRFEKSKPIC